jgi:hypothetical protein
VNSAGRHALQPQPHSFYFIITQQAVYKRFLFVVTFFHIKLIFTFIVESSAAGHGSTRVMRDILMRRRRRRRMVPTIP